MELTSLQESAEWSVPVLLVALQFILKLFVGEKVGRLATWKQLLQNPVDIAFVSLSFLASIIIADKERAGGVFVISLLYMLLLLISIIIWKYSPKTMAGAGNALKLLILNYLITLPMLVYSITLLGAA